MRRPGGGSIDQMNLSFCEGVGGIEAEAVMLGQAISMVLPQVLGYRITGHLNQLTTSTDVVLTITKVRLSVWSPLCLDNAFFHSFIQAISIVPLQVHYYSEALPTQRGYCVRVSRRSATGNCE